MFTTYSKKKNKSENIRTQKYQEQIIKTTIFYNGYEIKLIRLSSPS